MSHTAPLFPTPQERSGPDDYFTPAWVFERMGIEFDLDVAAPDGGVSWIPARRFLTKADDGLATDWTGRVWMNPPFSQATPWVAKFIAHGNGVALLPQAKSAWHLAIWRQADAVCLPADGFFNFIGTDDRTGSIMLPVFFAAFDAASVEAIGRLGVVRRAA